MKPRSQASRSAHHSPTKQGWCQIDDEEEAEEDRDQEQTSGKSHDENGERAQAGRTNSINFNLSATASMDGGRADIMNSLPA